MDFPNKQGLQTDRKKGKKECKNNRLIKQDCELSFSDENGTESIPCQYKG